MGTYYPMGQDTSEFHQMDGRNGGNQPMSGQSMGPMEVTYGENFPGEILFVDEVTMIFLVFLKTERLQRGVASGFGRGAHGRNRVRPKRIEDKQNKRLEKTSAPARDNDSRTVVPQMGAPPGYFGTPNGFPPGYQVGICCMGARERLETDSVRSRLLFPFISERKFREGIGNLSSFVFGEWINTFLQILVFFLPYPTGKEFNRKSYPKEKELSFAMLMIGFEVQELDAFTRCFIDLRRKRRKRKRRRQAPASRPVPVEDLDLAACLSSPLQV